ncbi:MAG TPA: endonuclease [Syntrophobacteraceae bacterium]|nr:endonuclease [Syntrophobacteraceae bacterium]HBD07943.1 endonuclease [Syntrophobacteraceae bacterium]HBZ54196.1 endonuclease [Syntrophobacteraceae bacterium]
MRVMTFNIRFENDRDGDNGWVFRRDLVIESIQACSPWILGTQEGTQHQLQYLRDHLPAYAMHAVGRPPEDAACQYPTLFYHSRYLDLVEGGEFWLSTTPQVHRSKDWDSAFPRMMSYARFRDKRSRRLLWAVVTHLDHMGQVARVQQAQMVKNWLQGCQEAKVLLGDFNDLPGSSVHQLLTASSTELQDSWQLSGRGEGEQSMTHHDFYGNPNKGRLDWILVSPHFQVRSAEIARNHQDQRFPSDHFPYWVDLDLV